MWTTEAVQTRPQTELGRGEWALVRTAGESRYLWVTAELGTRFLSISLMGCLPEIFEVTDLEEHRDALNMLSLGCSARTLERE